MLTREENELLTRTGPGTPMGRLLRCYWVPALLTEELPEPDCAPVRVTLLGEDLVAFRDSAGRPGLVDRFCAHRGASLFFGRNEERGIRCVYHGWKFDADGRCVDMPSEPSESNFKERVRLKAYPCCERGGIVWAYLGPAHLEPSMPGFEWAVVPDAQRCVSKRLQECNYLQALEGGVDLSHIAFLHRNLDTGDDGRDQALTRGDTVPHFEVVDTDYGLLVAARRNVDTDQYYWRINQFLMPWYTMFPPLVDDGIGGHAWVPIDDERCWVYNITWSPSGPLSTVGEGIYGELLPGTYRSRANLDNDFLIERDVQRTGSFTGIPGFAAQDSAVQESMGPICNRTQERLGSTDVPLIALRRRLKEALQALHDGRDLPGLDPVSQGVRPAALLLPRSVAFEEGARDALHAQISGSAAQR
jgi:nitrite reductase/ring-hydroxylating ferredoxin subunit